MRCHIGWTTAVRRVFRLEALHRSPGFDQCAIDREVLARQQPLDPGLRQNRTQKLHCDLASQKSVAVFRKGRVVPYRIVDAQPDKPAEQQIELQPLHQLAFSAPSRTPATASPAAASRARSMADQDRNRALQNPATAPTEPRWSAIGSPEADDRREPASPDRHTKTAPPRARQIPASLPPVRYPQSGNHS